MKFLQNLSYKTLFTILFLSLSGIIFFLRINKPVQEVSAAWWDDMWHYRKAINIDNPSGNSLTDFQVSISIGTSQLIADGKMQSTCDDIRITDINGNLLPYWIEENNPGCNQLTDTKIWIKANNIYASGSTIYIYYGNSNAQTNSNIAKTFGPLQKLSLNSNYTTVPTPSSSYPDNGGKQLTNGLIRENLFQTTEATVGWNYQNPTITINLNEVSFISSFKLYLGGGGAGGINIPAQINTYYSLDGSTYHPLQTGSGWGNSEQWVTINNNSIVSANYGQIEITTNQWTMVGEVEIYGYSRPNTSPSTQYSFLPEESGGGPIAYWKFDEGSGNIAYDSSGNNNGVINGASFVSDNQCISGKCLSFNGLNNFIKMSNINLDLTKSFTISFWINPLNYSNTRMLLSINDSDSNHLRFFQDNGNNTQGTFETDQSPGEIGNKRTLVKNNEWNHIVITWDGTNLSTYRNGLVYGNTVSSPFTFKTFTTLHIGSHAGSTYFYNGLLDDIKIYSYARTSNQIKQDYNSHGNSSSTGVNLGIKSNTNPDIKSSLVAYWKMDEVSGNTAYDSLTNKKNITMFGSTLPPLWQPTNQCIIGKCLYVNGSNASFGNSSFDFNILKQGQETASWTLSTWFKPDGVQDGGEKLIMGRPGCHGGIYANPNQFHFAIKTSECWTNAKSIIYTPPDMKSWYHLAAVYDNRNMFFYVNGKLVGTNSFTETMYAYGNTFYLGSYTTYSVKGWLDEAKVYNRALTADEIKQDYNYGSIVQFGSNIQNIDGITTDTEYCIPGDNSYCALPIAEWKIDEGVGTSVVDASGNKNTGSFGLDESSPTWSQGKTGKALSFDGNDYIDMGDVLNMGTNSMSISVWIKTTNIGTSSQYIISKARAAGQDYRYGCSTKEGKAAIFMQGDGGDDVSFRGNKDIADGKWHQISYIFDRENFAKIYIDGEYDSGQSISQWSGKNMISNNPFRIGSYTNSNNIDRVSLFYGTIDHIKIYDYARTPAQIAYDYNKGEPIGWWKFDECQGDVVYDWSNNKNNGTINIGANGDQNSLGTCQNGTSTAWVNGSNGKINSSINFDGTDDYVSVPSTSSLNFSKDSFSLSTWVKGNPQGNFKYIIIKSGSGGRYSIETYGNYWFWRIDDDQSNISSASVQKTVFDNKWHMITLVVDRINKKTYSYTDGVLSRSPDNISSLTGNISPTNNLYLGGTSYFSGQIDDTRIYNYALTEEQVKQIYNGGAINFK